MKLTGYVLTFGNSGKAYESGRGLYSAKIEDFDIASLQEQNIPLIANINGEDVVIANTKNGTLKLSKDNRGIYAQSEIFNEYLTKRASVGSIEGWKLEYKPLVTYWQRNSDGSQTLIIELFKVIDIRIMLMSEEPVFKSDLKVSFNY